MARALKKLCYCRSLRYSVIGRAEAVEGKHLEERDLVHASRAMGMALFSLTLETADSLWYPRDHYFD